MASCLRSLSIFRTLRAPIWRCCPSVRCGCAASFAERDTAVAQAAKAQARLSDSEALIASLELPIEKLKRELRGQRRERDATADRPAGIAARRTGDGGDGG